MASEWNARVWGPFYSAGVQKNATSWEARKFGVSGKKGSELLPPNQILPTKLESDLVPPPSFLLSHPGEVI